VLLLPSPSASEAMIYLSARNTLTLIKNMISYSNTGSAGAVSLEYDSGLLLRGTSVRLCIRSVPDFPAHRLKAFSSSIEDCEE